MQLEVLSYETQTAVFRPYNPLTPEVAALLIQALQRQDPRLTGDHIGSTAVPDCRGKGIVDLAITYRDGDLEVAKSALAALGFQPQTGRDPFPESRPMRVATVRALGSAFQVHAHVLLRDGDEHRTLLGFRDALRRDPALRAAYEADKERIVASGVTDSLQYCYAKEAFIASALSAIAK
jgi:GrpB-like predicted nucleotidyltransferase (UPF0157 family)